MTNDSEEWTSLPLSSLVKPGRPITYGVVQTGTPVEGGVPCVRVVDLTGDHLNPDEMIRTSPEISNQYSRTILEADDLMIALRGDIGCVAKVTPELIGANLTRGVALISPNSEVILPDYLLQALRSKLVRDELALRVNGSALKEIPIGELRKVPIPLPPLSAQCYVAEILAAWDRAIDLTTQLIAAKQQRKRGLMQDLLSGSRRLPTFKASHWTKRRLGDLFLERRETHRGDLPLLSITNKEGVIPRESVERRDTSNEDKSLYLRICPGDIGYNTMRMWQGVSAVSDLEGIVSPAYTICIPREGVDAHFMGYLFKLPSMIHRFQRFSQGLVDDTLSLKFDTFSKIEVIVPPIDAQWAIEEVLAACDHELDLLGQKVRLLKQQKQGLMQQLLTEKVQVPA